jgi:hypothetical protein
VNQTSGTSPAAAPPAAQDSGRSGQADDAAAGSSDATSGFGTRGRLRRRARFLRKARELAYRDLGGLVFNLHRFGERNDALVLTKLDMLAHIDAELRKLEAVLSERESLTVLREAGITACPRCAAIHSGEDRFCPNCGLSMSRHVDLPISGAPVPPAPPAPASAPATPAAAATPPAPAPAAAAAPSPATAPAATAAPPPATAPPAPPAAPRGGLQAPAAAGRSPTPPAPSTGTPSEDSESASPATRVRSDSSEKDEPTEIIRPRESDK